MGDNSGSIIINKQNNFKEHNFKDSQCIKSSKWTLCDRMIIFALSTTFLTLDHVKCVYFVWDMPVSNGGLLDHVDMVYMYKIQNTKVSHASRPRLWNAIPKEVISASVKDPRLPWIWHISTPLFPGNDLPLIKKYEPGVYLAKIYIKESPW